MHLLLGGNWGREIWYLGRNDMLHTHLGYFGASGRAGGGGRAMGNASQMSGFPIRQAVPVGLWAQFCSWACWVWFFTVNNVYYGRYNVFTCNLLFYKYLDRQDWVDGIGWAWMTTSKLGKLGLLGLGFPPGVARLGKKVYYSTCSISTAILTFLNSQGRRKRVDGVKW